MKKFLFLLLASAILITSPSVSFSASTYLKDPIITGTDGIYTDSRSFSTIAAAIAAIGAAEQTLLISEPVTSTNLTIPANVKLKFVKTGRITDSATLTINTTNIISEDRYIFTATTDIDFIAGSVVRSSWFLDLNTAIDFTNDNDVTLIISESDTITGTRTVGADVVLKWEAPGNLITATGLLEDIKNIEAGNYQLFTGAGDFDFLDGTRLKLSWFNDLRVVLTWVENEEVTIVVDGTHIVDFTQTSAANEFFDFQSEQGQFSINVGVTLTINSPSNITAQLDQQIKSGTGILLFTLGGDIYISWFGAVSGADNTSAIQQAFNSCPTTGGNVVNLTVDSIVKSLITISNPVIVKGNLSTMWYASDFTVGTFVDSTPTTYDALVMFLVDSDDVVFRDITFNGSLICPNYALYSGLGLHVIDFIIFNTGIENGLVEDCRFIDDIALAGSSIRSLGSTRNIIARYNTFINTDTVANSGPGAVAFNGIDSIMEGNFALNLTDVAFSCDAATRCSVINNKVINSYVTGGGASRSAGFMIQLAHGCQQCEAINNNIVGTRDAAIGVFSTAPFTTGLGFIIANNTIVSGGGTIAAGEGSRGIYVDGYQSNINITGNRITYKGTTTGALVYGIYAPAKNILIDSNFISIASVVGGLTDTAAISIAPGVNWAIISNNILNSNTIDIEIPSDAMTAAVIYVHGNTLNTPAAATIGIGNVVGLPTNYSLYQWSNHFSTSLAFSIANVVPRAAYVDQGDVTAKTTAVTLTIAELLTGIITGTHTAGATQGYTLPTGTDTDTGVSYRISQAFEWSLINLSAAAVDTITLTASAGHTIIGNPIIQSAHVTTGGVWGNSATFRTRKTAANTFITYRIN